MKDIPFEWRRGSFPPKPKTILVAGGAGFLGSHLCARFLNEGHRVICLDNFSTGKRENIVPFIGSPAFTLVIQDVTSPFMVRGDLHEIYNMACPASPRSYQENPIHTMMTNVIGAKNLLDLARLKGARILQSSTSEVYGDPEVAVQDEAYRGCVNTCGPRACYDEGKRMAETLFWEYHSLFRVQTRIARIFNTYGPRMHPHDGRVVSNFIRQSLSGEDLTVYGNGLQTRSFCYVSDMIEGLVRLMASDETMPVNIGNPDEFTINRLAQIVQRKTGTRSRIVYLDLPKDDPRQRRPDITRAKTILGWEPKIDLSQGLNPMIDWFEAELRGTTNVDAMVS